MIKENIRITQLELAGYIKVSRDVIKRNIATLKKYNIVIREGSTKRGIWKINE